MKYYPPTLHTQHHAMKHLPPQHATNSQNSPIFIMQGRTFFHNTHHAPTTHPHRGDISFNQQAQVLTKHKPHTTPQQQARNIANQQEPTEHQKRTACDITTTVGHPPRNLARNSIGRGFNKVRKRCNSNDLNSMFERVTGELRAKLLSGSGAWPGNETRQRANHQHARPHWCGGRRRVRRARAGFEARRRTK